MKKKKHPLRAEAQGRECTIQIEGICNGNPETTVLAHLNNKSMFGAGTGMKVPDIFAAFCCSACHDALDGRSGKIADPEDAKLIFYEGVLKTQNILLEEGKIKF